MCRPIAAGPRCASTSTLKGQVRGSSPWRRTPVSPAQARLNGGPSSRPRGPRSPSASRAGRVSGSGRLPPLAGPRVSRPVWWVVGVVRPGVWQPPVACSRLEREVIKRIKRAKLFVWLREHRHELFDEEFQGELAEMYQDKPVGQPPVPPAQLGAGDDPAGLHRRLRRRGARGPGDGSALAAGAGLPGPAQAPFSKTTLVAFRARLIEHDLDRRLVERTVALYGQPTGRVAGGSCGRRLTPARCGGPGGWRTPSICWATRCARRGRDGAPAGVGAGGGTGCWPSGRAPGVGGVEPEGGVGPGLGRPGRARSRRWGWCWRRSAGWRGWPPSSAAGRTRPWPEAWRRPARSTTRTVVGADGIAGLAPGGGPRPADLDRGRPDAPRPQDQERADRRLQAPRADRPGHRLVCAVGVTAANAPEAEVADQITADLARPGPHPWRAAHRPGLSVQQPGPRPRPRPAVFCKAWPVRNGPRFAKTAFTLDFDQHLLTCPNSVTVPFAPGGRVQFPARLRQPVRCAPSAPPAPAAAACRSTPTSGCWPSSAPRSRPPTGGPSCASGSRSSTPWPMSAAGRAPRPLPRPRKNLFDLRRVAVVHNLHVIARQPSPAKQAA